MNTTDEVGLLRAILLHPDEDTPRGMLRDHLIDAGRWTRDEVTGLVLRYPEADGVRLLAADWYDTAGERDRAEFTRVQCELAKMPFMGAKANDSRYRLPEPWRSLRNREFDLWGSIVADAHDNHGGLLWGLKAQNVTVTHIPAQSYPHDVYMVRRGFVAEVRCPLATLLGERCVMCRSKPKPCMGNACTPGIAADLFSRHPVTRVVATNKRPCRYGGCWFFHDDRRDMNAVEDPSIYWPAEVYDRIEWTFDLTTDPPWSSLTSEAAANVAANAALVAVGRERAGLPPLEVPSS